MALKPLFKNPVGASEHCSELSTVSENAPEVISCQLCGTKYLKYEDDHNDSDYYFHFLGYLGIKQCCGKLIDILYQQWGVEFFERRLSDFEKEPRSCNNHYMRLQLEKAVRICRDKS